MNPYRTSRRGPRHPREPAQAVGGHVLVLLPLAISSLRVCVAIFDPHPPLDEVLLAVVIAIVCVVIVVVELRQPPSAPPPEEP